MGAARRVTVTSYTLTHLSLFSTILCRSRSSSGRRPKKWDNPTSSKASFCLVTSGSWFYEKAYLIVISYRLTELLEIRFLIILKNDSLAQALSNLSVEHLLSVPLLSVNYLIVLSSASIREWNSILKRALRFTWL